MIALSFKYCTLSIIQNTAPDDDTTDTLDTVVDSSVGVMNDGYDFVESDNGLINGAETDDDGNPFREHRLH